jgi:glycosyltransferase involved in cell wall biosynthesis
MSRSLRIAQIAAPIESVPPTEYGGTERVIATLIRGLSALGHQLTLYASGDSVTQAKLISVCDQALRRANMLGYGIMDLTMFNIGRAYADAAQGEYDVVHDHNAILGLPLANLCDTPAVMTVHGPFTDSNRGAYEELDKPHLVAISQAQASLAPGVKFAGVIHNGLAMDHYPFGARPGAYLLTVGRISDEKGTLNAIQVANELDMPLVIAAKLDPYDTEYYHDVIARHIDGERIKWEGEVNETRRNELMSGARCLLHPINWPEPFGLVMIEAMACGTPVIAFDQGSVPEVVLPGTTGLIVPDIDGMVDAVRQVDQIDRRACRDYALHAFSAERMTQAYADLYESLVP